MMNFYVKCITIYIFTIEIIMYLQYPNFMPSVFCPVWIWTVLYMLIQYLESIIKYCKTFI